MRILQLTEKFFGSTDFIKYQSRKGAIFFVLLFFFFEIKYSQRCVKNKANSSVTDLHH